VRFAFAHKFSTYLMAVCALFALIFGGEVGPVTSLILCGGVVGSWFWEPPRIDFDRWNLVWTVLSILVFASSVLMVLLGADVLVIGAEFLMYLLVVKLFNRRTNKDYQHVYILTFLQLVAGTVLNTEFTYGFFFLGYVIAATWALILFHLRREMEDNFLLKHSADKASERVAVKRILNSRRIVGRRFFVGTSVVSMTVFFASVLLFLMVPRIGFGLFFNKKRSGVNMTGFSDGVTLAGHGLLKSDRTVVMRVKVPGRYQGRDAPYIHWRGVAFDQYKNGRWRRTREAPPTRQTIIPSGNYEQHHLLYQQGNLTNRMLHYRLNTGMKQEIYLEPLGYDVLFGASMPLVFEYRTDFRKRRRHSRKVRNDEIRHAHTAGIHYTVYSRVQKPPARLLRKAPHYVPLGFDVYTKWQWPHAKQISKATIELAKKITRGLTNDYDRAVAIETWLRTKLGYTLEMKDPGEREPIDFFLFHRKKGHCEYFSSAMTIMLRILDIPARNVNGFLGGEWNEYDDYIAVRAGDAHSWVEAYFQGYGWVTFDPTPPGQRDSLGRGGGGWVDKIRRWFDTLRFKWFKWVIEYDLARQLSLFKSLGNTFRRGTSSLKLSLGSLRSWAKRNKWTLLGCGGFVVLLIGFLWWRRRRRRQGRGTSSGGGRRGPRNPVAALYNVLLAKLARYGIRRAPSLTPREHATALRKASAPGATEFAELTELYYDAEYGERIDRDRIDRAEALRGQILQLVRAAKR